MAAVEARSLLCGWLDAGLAAVAVEHRLPPHLPAPPRGRTVVVGAGKAAAAMAQVVEAHWPHPLSGLVVTRYGHVPASAVAGVRRIEVIEAGHPLPDAHGEAAARRIFELAHTVGADDLLLCLISGGGSALLSLPAPGLTLADKRAVTGALLASGATIREINCVRKHLSLIKGGRLALAAAPARVVTLLVSDVPGDDPSVIASGPTVVDGTTCAEALAVLFRYRVTPPLAVATHLMRPQPDISDLARLGCVHAGSETVVIAAAQDALKAAAAAAQAAGVTPLILGDAIEGEAREVARVHAGIVRQILRHGQPVAAPAVILSGGETTVTVRGAGHGGRNTEFALALALALEGVAGVSALACDTDGIDGTGDAAGALVFPETLTRAAALGLDARAHLADNDSGGFFARLGDTLVTGPTFTNVNDFRAIVVDPDGRVVIPGRMKP